MLDLAKKRSLLKKVIPSTLDSTIFLIGLIIFLSFVIGIIGCIWGTVTPFEGIYANGTFQMLNPLRRIDSGQTIGKDFVFFHGGLLPYFYYPLYKFILAFSPNSSIDGVFAAELSRRFTTAFVGFLSLGSFCYGVVRSRHFLLMIGLILAIFDKDLFLSPTNSLMPFRSAFPLIFASTFFFCFSGYRQLFWRALQGVLFCLAILNSTEQGIYLAFGFILSLLIVVLLRRGSAISYSQKLIEALFFGLGLGIAFALIFYVIFHGSWDSIVYNYKTVSQNQFWYFGGPPARVIYDLKTLFHRYNIRWLYYGLASLTTLVILFWLQNKRKLENQYNLYPLLVLFCYGLPSILSMFGSLGVRHYLMPAEKSFILIITATIYFIFHSKRLKVIIRQLVNLKIIEKFIRSQNKCIHFFALALTSMFMVYLCTTSVIIFTSGPPRLSDKWTSWEKQTLAIIQKDKSIISPKEKPIVWSSYSNFLEQRLNSFIPADDYIIHALGDRWDKYLKAFKDNEPPFVITTGKSFGFTEWLIVSNWEFWEELLKNYYLEEKVGYSLIWHRISTSPKTIESIGQIKVKQQCNAINEDEFEDEFRESQFNVQNGCLEIPHRKIRPAQSGLYILDLEYQIHNPLSKIPFFGLLPRYFVSISGAVNNYDVFLNPHKQKQSIPVFVNYETAYLGEPIIVNFRTKNIFQPLSPETSVQVKNAKLRWLEIPLETRLRLIDRLASYDVHDDK